MNKLFPNDEDDDATSNSQIIRECSFYVEGDMNEYHHDSSMRMSGQGNVMLNRSAMINAGEGSHVTINHFSCPCSHSRPALQQTHFKPKFANACQTDPFNAPAPVTMPVPSTSLNTPSPSPTATATQKIPPVQMPVPVPAPPPVGTEMPSAPHDAVWGGTPITPTTPPHDFSQERSFDETRPAFRLSVHNPPHKSRWPPSSNRSPSAPHRSTAPPPHTVNVSYVPLTASPQQVPSYPRSANQPSWHQRDNSLTSSSQTGGRSLAALELQRSTGPTWPSEIEVRGVRESGSFSPPAELSWQGEGEEDAFEFDVGSPKKKLRRVAKITRGDYKRRG